MFSLTKVDFTRVLLFDQGNALLPASWHGEPVALDLSDVVLLKHELAPLSGWRDFAACYPHAAVQNIGYVLQKAQVAQDHVLEAAALSELALHASSFDLGIEYLTTARDILLADVQFEEDRMIEAWSRIQTNEGLPPEVALAEFCPRQFAGVTLKPCKELREIENLRRLQSARRETDALLSPRRDLLELVAHNLHQFILRQKSEFLRNRRICIDAAVRREDWRDAVQMANLTLAAAENGFGVNHWWLGVIEMRLGLALLRQGKIEMSREHLPRAEQILVDWVTESPDCVFKEVWQLLQIALDELSAATE